MSNREQEMNEIHKGIWQIANDLRGAVDGRSRDAKGDSLSAFCSLI